MDINTWNKLRGLKASDRTAEEQAAINEQMGYKEKPKVEEIKLSKPSATLSREDSAKLAKSLPSNSMNLGEQYRYNMAANIKAAAERTTHLMDLYNKTLSDYQEQYGVGRNSVNSNSIDLIDSISRENSSYYKRYYGTSKLSDEDIDKKQLAAQYMAWKDTYGEDVANIKLDKYYKNIVGEHQSGWEQAMMSVGHLIPTIEGATIQTIGTLYGLINPLLGLINEDLALPENDNLYWWENYLNNIIDNPITRYGRDIELSGGTHLKDIGNLLGLTDDTSARSIARMKDTATKYNPEGIGDDAIVLTDEQDKHLINTSTPWEALYSGGYTAFSMLTGSALAKGSQLIFNNLSRGLNYLNRTNRMFKTAESLEKALTNLKKVQNAADIAVIPGLVGTTEGLQEGLNTKIQIQQDKGQELDDHYKDLIIKETNSLYENDKYNPLIEVRSEQGKTLKRAKSREQVFQEVFEKYKGAYNDTMDQIDYASSVAGVQNMWANSLVNGMLNSTLKATLLAPRTQEALRNSKLFGWAYRSPNFNIGTNGTVTPKMTKAGTVLKVLKEPAGEGLEEYFQSLSNDTFVGAAENNINEFVKARFSGDSTVKVGDHFSSDWGAAATAFTGSLTSQESLKSAILGAVGSVMGTIALPGRNYRKDERGNLVQNKFFSTENFKKGLREDGTQESTFDVVSRLTPWRSSVVSAYRERKKELQDANDTAELLTEWLQNPKNREKWDGLVGTMSWLDRMENAAESNDQFSYRNAQMGKAINDIMMLNKLKGTAMYEAILNDLQRSADMDVTSAEGQTIIAKMRAADTEGLQDKTDEEILEKVQSNANKMLGLISATEKEGKYFDRLLGRIDDTTKQSLVFGKLMEQNFRERKDKLEREAEDIKSKIRTSRASTSGGVDEDLKGLILEYGSVGQAIKEENKLREKKEKAEKKVAEITAIEESKRTDKQKELLDKNQKEVELLSKQLSTFEGLYERDEDGKVIKGRMKSGLTTMVLNEDDIMNLDARTRAKVLASGATRYYNVTHQNRQRIDAINEELNAIQKKIDALEEQKKQWVTADGKIKKGHNKQVQRNNKAIESLEKDKFNKMRELNTERGDADTKSIFSEEQQAVIDNLLQQATAIDEDALDKIVDIGRLESAIKNYHQQYQAILSDPHAFNHYVKRAKQNLAIDLATRRAERIADIEDFKEFSQELNKLTANASPVETFTIFNTLREHDNKKRQDYIRQREQEEIDRIIGNNEESKTESVENKVEDQLVIGEDGNVHLKNAPSIEFESNFNKYMNNQKRQEALISQFAKVEGLTDNDMSLLIAAMQYLQQNGIDVTDRDAAVEALVENDESGIIGGKFRQWVEERNAGLSEEQRAHMPIFTSIGQVVSQYVEILNEEKADAIDKGNIAPTVINEEQLKEGDNVIVEEDSPESDNAHRPGIFDVLGNNSPNDGHFIDNNGTVSTTAAIEAGKGRTQESSEDNSEEAPKTKVEEAFSRVTSPEIAKFLNILYNLLESTTFPEEGKNVVLSEEEKTLIEQSLVDVAVNSDETFDNLDEVIGAILGKVEELNKQQDMMEDESDKRYGHAASVLRALTARLRVIERKQGTESTDNGERNIENSSIIISANIPYMAQKNHKAWAVQFTNDHNIDGWNRDNVIALDTPIYFITDSEWTADVTAQMDSPESIRNYDTLTDMPVVMAVEVEAPKNNATTTAIQVGEKWYQPIGILPSVKSELKTSGSRRTQEIRRLASKDQGVHLVMAEGNSVGTPLISYVAGKHYIDAEHSDAKNKRVNSKDNNTDLIEDILAILPTNSSMRLLGMSKEERLKDPEYRAAREKVLNRLSWGEGYVGSTHILNNKVLYTPDDLKGNEGKPSDKSAQPMILFIKGMSETAARNSDKTLPQVLHEGNLDDIVTFNSRTEGLYNNVIRPLFEHLVFDHHEDRSARVVTQEDYDKDSEAFDKEAARLNKYFNKYDGTKDTKGIESIYDYVHIKEDSGWHITVVAYPDQQVISDIASSKSIYKVLLENSNTDEDVIELGTITAQAHSGINNQSNIEDAKNLLKNFLKECTEGVLKDDAYWQVKAQDIKSINSEKDNIRNIVRNKLGNTIDDGIFELGGSSLVYNIYGVKVKAPISNDGKVVYPERKVTNNSNAKPSAPINTTPQGDGAVQLGNGRVVDGKTGASLDNSPKRPKTPQMSEAEKRAKALTDRIVMDSKEFTLSKDGLYYYIINKATGEEVKYLRVTTIIAADDNVGQWYPSEKDWETKLGKPLSEKVKSQLRELAETTNSKEGVHFDSDTLNFETRKLLYDILAVDGIAKEDVDTALAELRTEHKKTKFQGWGVPSTTLGNTADTITRDFFAGDLQEHYPNISDAVLSSFISDLQSFKNDLESRGIKIVSEGVMAHGKITVTKDDGSTQDVNVAGTLDLFGYDSNGNFYIFDMKTTRDHSTEKLEREKGKWSRQISMYADLLKQSYPDFKIKAENLRIIPINVHYNAPRGKYNPGGPVYSVTDKGQLQMTVGTETEDYVQTDPSNFKLRGRSLSEQFQPGYTHIKVNWDNLSSEDREIADFLRKQTSNTGNTEGAPAKAEITSSKRENSLTGLTLDLGGGYDEWKNSNSTSNNSNTAPPAANQSEVVLPSWEDLSSEAKETLKEAWLIDNEWEYNDAKDDDGPALWEFLSCRNSI